MIFGNIFDRIYEICFGGETTVTKIQYFCNIITIVISILEKRRWCVHGGKKFVVL